MNRVMNTKQNRLIRSRVCAALWGDVIETGFGTGLNVPHLPPRVEVLRAVDPLERGRVLASERIETSAIPVEFVGLDGQSLPLATIPSMPRYPRGHCAASLIPSPRCAKSAGCSVREGSSGSSSMADRRTREYSSGSGA